MDQFVGGYTGDKPMDNEVRSMTLSQKEQIESKLNTSFSVFNPLSYQTQVVAGINYKVKVDVGEGKEISVVIFKALPCYGGNLEVSKASFIAVSYTHLTLPTICSV
eukprot:TRINITY_DN6501_c0_g1_i7.p1 TRINITY_DN6501_c0_g1~~TRINITY_DN6501_c0_g1_i7.p1  ORF type:complete len:106 (-),score=28.97 TRINITY_DN6501_c0_g1_i7:45-362(-)